MNVYKLINEGVMSFFSPLSTKPTDVNMNCAPDFPHWPRALNYPPSANVSIQTLLKYAKPSTLCPSSFGKFKEFVQAQQAAGCDTVTIVSRGVFETAKSHLMALHWKLYQSIEVMQGSAHLTGLGVALIVIGAIGVYLTQPSLVKPDAPKRNWSQIFSYGAMVTGLVLVVLATYRLQSTVNLLKENFEQNPPYQKW